MSSQPRAGEIVALSLIHTAQTCPTALTRQITEITNSGDMVGAIRELAQRAAANTSPEEVRAKLDQLPEEEVD